MNRNKILFLLLFIFNTTFLFAKSPDEDECIYLTENWSYSITNGKNSYYLITNNDLGSLKKLLNQKEGYIWLKTTFYLPEEYKNENLAVYLGIVKIANEAYLNGTYIGKNGSFPPNVFSVGEISSAYNLPSSLLNYGFAENELVIKIWISGYGQISKKPFISTQKNITHIKAFNDFYNSKLFFIFSTLFLLISGIYFLLYFFRKTEKQHLSFSGLTFFSSFFLVTVCIGEYPIIFKEGYSFLLYEKIFHGIAGTLSSHFAISFIRDFFKVIDSKKRKIYRYSMTILALIALICPRDLSTFYVHLNVSYLLIVIQLLYAIRIITKAFINKDKRVFILLAGFSPELVSLVIAVIMFFLPNGNYSLLILASGWLATILLFLGILIYILAKSQNEAEYLNKNLENIVQKRTAELADSNTQLEIKNNQLQYDKDRTQKEIELAAFVQQSFYHQSVPELDDWELTYYLKPMAGVSGDLYDFFCDNHNFNGLGIFDVSGHGISSGLVTMLVKNIIEQEFYAGVNEKLEDVMYIINDRVIEEKGNIENYLTGILSRINGNELEFVNAGHPSPFFYHKETAKLEILQKDTSQCGVIGISDFPINFKTNKLTLQSGDSLLFYTDGITEAVNENNEEFGTDRLFNAFDKCKKLPINEQIYSILNALSLFTGSVPLNDDITLIVLRKK